MDWERWKNKESWDSLWARPYINYRKHHRLFWDLIEEKSTGKILDLGCGPACIWEGTNKDVTGVDYSKNAILEAEENFPSGRFIVSDVADVPLFETFDTIVLCGVVNYFTDLSPLKKEVKRLGTSCTRVLITINDLRGLNKRYWDISAIMKEFSQWGDLRKANFYDEVGWLIEVVL